MKSGKIIPIITNESINCIQIHFQKKRTNCFPLGFWDKNVKKAVVDPISNNCLIAANDTKRNDILPKSSGPSNRANRIPVAKPMPLLNKLAVKLAANLFFIEVLFSNTNKLTV
jgi:hypothetical protein